MTCKKARDWLDKNNIDYEERDIKGDNPNESELLEWISKSQRPLKMFFNSRGRLYKELNIKEKLKTMTERELIKILGSDGMLVKRPILVGEEIVLVGFKEDEWKVLKQENE